VLSRGGEVTLDQRVRLLGSAQEQDREPAPGAVLLLDDVPLGLELPHEVRGRVLLLDELPLEDLRAQHRGARELLGRRPLRGQHLLEGHALRRALLDVGPALPDLLVDLVLGDPDAGASRPGAQDPADDDLVRVALALLELRRAQEHAPEVERREVERVVAPCRCARRCRPGAGRERRRRRAGRAPA
jgi:hypothetical protein